MDDERSINAFAKLKLELEIEKILVDQLFQLVKGIYGEDLRPLPFENVQLDNIDTPERRELVSLMKARYASINAIIEGGPNPSKG